MSANPFEPPSDLADQGAVAAPLDGRDRRVYTPNHAALAAFIGSPVAGAWIIASNYSMFEQQGAKWRALGVGLVATVALFTLAFLLPQGTPNSILPVAYTFAIRELAKRLQGADVERVLATGGTQYSGWRAAGVGAMCLTIVCVFLFLGILVFAPETPVP